MLVFNKLPLSMFLPGYPQLLFLLANTLDQRAALLMVFKYIVLPKTLACLWPGNGIEYGWPDIIQMQVTYLDFWAPKPTSL